jgi:hypothetical protein
MRARSAACQARFRSPGGAGATIWANISRSGPRSRLSDAVRLAWSLTSPWTGRQSSCQPASLAIRFQNTRCARPFPSRNGCPSPATCCRTAVPLWRTRQPGRSSILGGRTQRPQCSFGYPRSGSLLPRRRHPGTGVGGSREFAQVACCRRRVVHELHETGERESALSLIKGDPGLRSDQVEQNAGLRIEVRVLGVVLCHDRRSSSLASDLR